MVDQPSDKVPATGLAALPAQWRQRVAGRRAMLLATLSVFIVFVLIGSLTMPEAAAGFVAIALVALLLPTGIDRRLCYSWNILAPLPSVVRPSQQVYYIPKKPIKNSKLKS